MIIRLGVLLTFLLAGAARAQSPAELAQILDSLPKAPGKRVLKPTRTGLPELFTQGVLELKNRGDVPANKVFALYMADAQAGDPVAQASVARLYNKGVGVVEDKAQAVAWARKAAEQGYAVAATLLAGNLFKGEGVPADKEAAYGWYRKAAEQGEPIAEYMVGWHEVYGQGTHQDIADGQRWLIKAARDDMPDALPILVATLPRDGGRSVAPAYTRSKLPALSWWTVKTLKERPDLADMVPLLLAAYQRDAETGDAVAEYSVSMLYRHGVGVPQDIGKARELARKSAEGGYALGALHLGQLLDEAGGDANAAEAYRWYRRAADEGEPAAQFNVAVLLTTGRGVGQDKKQALEWLRKAADGNFAPAIAELSRLYESGEGGLDKDPQTALRLQERAAELGEANAQKHLGNRYAFGVGGVSRDIKKATELYRRASVLLGHQAEEQLRRCMVQAQAAIREKNFGEAQTLLEQARDIAPWSEPVWYNTALVHAENAYFEWAIEDMQVFLALAPNSPQARGAQDLIYEWERKVKK